MNNLTSTAQKLTELSEGLLETVSKFKTGKEQAQIDLKKEKKREERIYQSFHEARRLKSEKND